MKLRYIGLFVALFFAVNGLFAQVHLSPRATCVITITDDNNGAVTTASDTLGIAVGATACIDVADSIGEAEAPPPGPSGLLDTRFNEKGASCMGQGLWKDLQGGSVSAGIKDTFRLSISWSDDIAASGKLSWRWSAAAASLVNSATMIWNGTNANGDPTPNVDMLTDTTVDLGVGAGDRGNTKARMIIDWKPIPLISGVLEQKSAVPAAFALNQNYPNPFNPSTTVSFAIEKAAFADISVYNVLGQKVATLVSQQVNPGTFSTRWNGVDDRGNVASSGVYYVRMSANYGNSGETFNQVRKMLLMK